MKTIFHFLIVLIAGLLLSTVWALEEGSPSKAEEAIEITADGENRFEAGMAYASGNVIMRYRGDVIYADEIAYNSKAREVTATGNVRIYTSKGGLFRSDMATYNFETKKVISSSFMTGHTRYFAKGEEFLTSGPNHYTVRKGKITTDNRENPSYHFHANTIEIYPDERVVLKNTVMYVGNFPVLWVPYFVYSLGKNRTSLDINAGSTRKFGGYARLRYTVDVSPKLTTAFNVDYFAKRGPGGGVDFDYQPNKDARALFRSFWIQDRGNEIDVGSANRLVKPPEKRFRFSYKHNAELGSDLHTIADINVWSDRNVTQDFFTREFTDERVPDNFANVMYYNPNFAVSMLGRSQANNLFEVAERKPEFTVEFKRQPLFGSPIVYEGESSVVNFEQNFDRDANLRSYRSVRYDTVHQLLYPRQYFGWLSLTPRVGARFTTYTRNNSANNPHPEGEVHRAVLNSGLEASFKLTRTWLDAQNEALGIDGLRHVFEPFIDFSYIPTPNQKPNKFRGYDTHIPNTRLRPLSFPAYNSIDSINRTSTLRHGFRNKLQTKRDGANLDLISWATYADLDMEREVDERYGVINQEYDEAYNQIYNDFEMNPFPWLTLDIQSSAGIGSQSFNEVRSALTWHAHRALDLTVSNSYLENVPFSPQSSNLIGLGSFWRLNESWQVSQDLTFEAANGTVQEQRYSIYRDLTSWNAGLHTVIRDNENAKDEFIVFFSMTLKAFPDQSISIGY